MIILVLYAFIAGFITILSPCILPILPIVLSTTTSGNISYKRPLGIITGFVSSFTFFTLFLSTIVRATGLSADVLRNFSILVVLILGISLVSSRFQTLVEKLFSSLANKIPNFDNGGSGFSSGFLIGISLGLLWTPCVGPILASVITLALTGQVTFQSFIITVSYAIGTAIPMFVVLVGGRALFNNHPWLLRNTPKIQKLFGLFTIFIAFALYLGWDRSFQVYILNKFPQYGANLTKIEDNQKVKELLDVSNIKESKKNLAPDFIPGGQWINTPPLSMANLKGKVVLVDFWTYTCINCIRTLPYLKSWHQKYADKGLVIVGVHTPEFEFEKDLDNVQKAVTDFGIFYPVVQDNNYSTWGAYKNRYWPAKYLIDKYGQIRFTHFGEGEYDETEKMIQDLLIETGSEVNEVVDNKESQNYSQTPETYLGYGRGDTNILSLLNKEEYADQKYPSKFQKNQLAFQGSWLFSKEYAQSSTGSELTIDFTAKNVYLVMNAVTDKSKVEVYLDGSLVKEIEITDNKLYDLLELSSPGRHKLTIKFVDGKTRAYAFTFG